MENNVLMLKNIQHKIKQYLTHSKQKLKRLFMIILGINYTYVFFHLQFLFKIKILYKGVFVCHIPDILYCALTNVIKVYVTKY